jgi:putative endonuclease
MKKQELGRLAEDAAASLYSERGYRVVARNVRYGKIGELDLILSRVLSDGSPELVFCEVKCRSDTEFAPPASAVTYQKQGRIQKLAQIFLLRHEAFYQAQLRFDVAEVAYRNGAFRVNILENAF